MRIRDPFLGVVEIDNKERLLTVSGLLELKRRMRSQRYGFRNGRA